VVIDIIVTVSVFTEKEQNDKHITILVEGCSFETRQKKFFFYIATS